MKKHKWILLGKESFGQRFEQFIDDIEIAKIKLHYLRKSGGNGFIYRGAKNDSN